MENTVLKDPRPTKAYEFVISFRWMCITKRWATITNLFRLKSKIIYY